MSPTQVKGELIATTVSEEELRKERTEGEEDRVEEKGREKGREEDEERRKREDRRCYNRDKTNKIDGINGEDS